MTIFLGSRSRRTNGIVPERRFYKMEGEAHRAKNEKVEVLYQPDTLIAFEYFSHVRKKKSLEPEKRLMLAVLRDAIYCFKRAVVKGRLRAKSEFCEAEEWFWEDGENWPFSYKNICNEIGLDPSGIRNKLKQWKRMRFGRYEKSRALGRSMRNEVKDRSRAVAYGRPQAWGNHGKA